MGQLTIYNIDNFGTWTLFTPEHDLNYNSWGSRTVRKDGRKMTAEKSAFALYHQRLLIRPRS